MNSVDRRELDIFNHASTSFFNENGIELLNENKEILKHVDLIEDLKQKLPVKKIISEDKSVHNSQNFIAGAVETLQDHPEDNTSILGSLVQVAIASMKGRSNNFKVSEAVQDFLG